MSTSDWPSAGLAMTTVRAMAKNRVLRLTGGTLGAPEASPLTASSTDEGAEEEPDIGRPLGNAASEIRVPGVAIGNVHPHGISIGHQVLLEAGANAVEHLELPRCGAGESEFLGDPVALLVMGGDGRFHRFGAHEGAQQGIVGGIDLLAGPHRDRFRLVIGPLA